MDWATSRLPSSLRPAKEQIYADLVEAQYLFASHHLFDLFNETVVEIINQGGVSEMKQLVSTVTAKLRGLGPVELQNSSTYSRRQRQVTILQDALHKMKGAARNEPRELTAIDEDNKIFLGPANNVLTSPVNQSNTSLPLVVYDMVKPGVSHEIPISDDCRFVRQFLQVEGLATYPEIWARYRERQNFTPNGYLWEWLQAEEPVQGKYIEFVDRVICTNPAIRDYIIALKFESNPEPKETAVPLDLPPRGVRCCLSQCPYLLTHLKAKWPHQKVLRARNLKGRNVMGDLFDDLLFDPRTNSLIVDVETV